MKKMPSKSVKKPTNGGTGKLPFTLPAAVELKPPATDVMLKEEDQKVIREFDQALHKTKMELANLVVQIEMLTAQKQQLVNKLLETDRGFFERIKKTATEYGLDIEKEKWNFDAGKMAFSKLA